jgi:hypothetical protein
MLGPAVLQQAHAVPAGQTVLTAWRVALVRVERLGLGVLIFPVLSMGKGMFPSVSGFLP